MTGPPLPGSPPCCQPALARAAAGQEGDPCILGGPPVTASAPRGPLPSLQSPPAPPSAPRARGGSQEGEGGSGRGCSTPSPAGSKLRVEASSHLSLTLGKDDKSLFPAFGLHFLQHGCPAFARLLCFVCLFPCRCSCRLFLWKDARRTPTFRSETGRPSLSRSFLSNSGVGATARRPRAGGCRRPGRTCQRPARKTGRRSGEHTQGCGFSFHFLFLSFPRFSFFFSLYRLLSL